MADTDSLSVDWEGALWDTIAHLQALIRMDTVNPPGNEIGLARYLDDVLRGAGISTTLVEPAPGRAALMGRISGDGSRRPLLLLAHMDVVGVERERWQTNPFGGELLDGFLYGRGAIDDKGMLATNLQTMLLVQRHLVGGGSGLSRDLLFLATSDEEAGGVYGIDWVIDHHPEFLDAEYALNEGGRIRTAGGNLLYGAIQCAEKVPNVVRVTASGPSGHASIPLAGNAVARLARAVDRIAAHREPVLLSDLTRRFFAGLAARWPEEREREAMADLASSDEQRQRNGAIVIAGIPHLDALIRNGISPTMLEGGVRPNVIPATASAILNVRTLPGESLDGLLERLRAVVADAEVAMSAESRGLDAPLSPPTSPMYAAIEGAMAQLAPGVPVVPYLSTGATDSAPLRRLGIKAYGLLPFPLAREDEERMHGHDERLPVSSLDFGVRLTFDIVRRVNAG